MTDAPDSCFGCGGHLRGNVYSGTLCPLCVERRDAGEMDDFGRLTPLRNGGLGIAPVVRISATKVAA